MNFIQLILASEDVACGLRRKNPPMKKRVLLVVLVVAIVAILLYTFLARNQRGNDHFISISGNIEATEVDVGFKISGRIVNRPFEEGDWVEKGQVLARLDDEDLRNRLEVARATVVSARARLDKLLAGSRPEEIREAEAAVQQAQFDLENKQITYERMKLLYERQVIPKETYDNAETALQGRKGRFAEGPGELPAGEGRSEKRGY